MRSFHRLVSSARFIGSFHRLVRRGVSRNLPTFPRRRDIPKVHGPVERPSPSPYFNITWRPLAPSLIKRRACIPRKCKSAQGPSCFRLYERVYLFAVSVARQKDIAHERF